MVTNNSIPKVCVKKFLLKGKNSKLYVYKNQQCLQVSYYSLNKTPSIPNESTELKELLAAYEGDYLQSTQKCKRIPVGKTKRMNGFLAYRVFYSRKIKEVSKQRQFSASLAKLWKDEKNKDDWKALADEYNRTMEVVKFVDWIDNLKLGKKNPQHFFSRENNNDSKVEDVYLIL